MLSTSKSSQPSKLTKISKPIKPRNAPRVLSAQSHNIALPKNASSTKSFPPAVPSTTNSQAVVQTAIVPNPPDNFPWFAKFPPEIKDRVWFYSLPPPTIKEGRFDGRATLEDTSLYIENTMFPVHLQTCSGSRQVFLKHYTAILGRPAKVFLPGHIFVRDPNDPETDLGDFGRDIVRLKN